MRVCTVHVPKMTYQWCSSKLASSFVKSNSVDPYNNCIVTMQNIIQVIVSKREMEIAALSLVS